MSNQIRQKLIGGLLSGLSVLGSFNLSLNAAPKFSHAVSPSINWKYLFIDKVLDNLIGQLSSKEIQEKVKDSFNQQRLNQRVNKLRGYLNLPRKDKIDGHDKEILTSMFRFLNFMNTYKHGRKLVIDNRVKVDEKDENGKVAGKKQIGDKEIWNDNALNRDYYVHLQEYLNNRYHDITLNKAIISTIRIMFDSFRNEMLLPNPSLIPNPNNASVVYNDRQNILNNAMNAGAIENTDQNEEYADLPGIEDQAMLPNPNNALVVYNDPQNVINNAIGNINQNAEEARANLPEIKDISSYFTKSGRETNNRSYKQLNKEGFKDEQERNDTSNNPFHIFKPLGYNPFKNNQ